MIYTGPPTAGAQNYAGLMLHEANRLQAESERARDNALNLMLAQRQRIFEDLDRLGQAHKQRQAERAAKHGGKGGAIGAGVGAVAGAVLAPVTFGASLALPAAIGTGAALGSGLGGGIGNAIDPAPGRTAADAVPQITNSLAAGANVLNELYVQNPFYTPRYPTGNGAGPGGAPVQSTQFR